MRAKSAACQQRNSHGGKVTVADGVVMDVGFAMSGEITLHPDAVIPSAFVEGENRKTGGPNAGKRADALFDLLVEIEEASVFEIAGGTGIDAESKDILLVETGIDIGEIEETADEKAGTHKQDERQRHL